MTALRSRLGRKRVLWTAVVLAAALTSPGSPGAVKPQATGTAAPPDTGRPALAFAVPAWAYPADPPAGDAATPAHDDTTARHVPDSSVTFTDAQVHDRFAPPDWHPEEHPPMAEVVARGRKPSVLACGYCHLPNGKGRPENAALAGLPATYIVDQVIAFRTGARRSAWAGAILPNELMRKAAAAATDKEIAAAAVYFSGLQLTRRVEIVETERVPKTHVAGWLYVVDDDAGTEPLGARIIEVAVDHARHELRDSASGFRAYVPRGSTARGRLLAVRGGYGRTVACARCHGAALKGAGAVPSIAGRSPSYIVRQLLAFRTGARSNAAGQPMQPVVARLDIDDMIALAAYVAAQAP